MSKPYIVAFDEDPRSPRFGLPTAWSNDDWLARHGRRRWLRGEALKRELALAYVARRMQEHHGDLGVWRRVPGTIRVEWRRP